MSQSNHAGVALKTGLSGSKLLHKILSDAIAAYPHVFGNVRLPSSVAAFKKSFAEDVVRFEHARANAAERVEIATFMCDTTQDALEFEGPDGREPLVDFIARASVDAVIGQAVVTRFGDTEGLVPEVVFEGKNYRGPALSDLADVLTADNLASDNASAGIRWIANYAEANGGKLDLRGQRFAILGAAAELAPTTTLLRAGATVLWIDISEPEEALARYGELSELAGEVHVVEGARDLLQDPHRIAAAIRAFAVDGPVNVGLFAYAPGKGREVRLTASMEAIVRVLSDEVIKSVSLYISPTVPACVDPMEQSRAADRKAAAPAWQKLVCSVASKRVPGHYLGREGGIAVARAVVGLQGAGYLAAQYVAKIAAAERWSARNPGIALSTNVAGITDTRSLSHPLFQVAFVGSKTLGVHIFKPATTRNLSALLMLRDVLDPEAPGAGGRIWKNDAERARSVLSQQIHGGAYVLPWAFQAIIQVAAVVGTVKRPGLLLKKAK